jgi:hypothetical protein
MRTAILRAVLAVTLGAGDPAAADVTAELLRCRQIADARARVSCYDAIALPAAPVAATPSAGGGGATAEGRVASAPAPLGVIAPTAAVTPTSDPTFGLPAKPVHSVQEAVESAIVGSFDGWIPDGRFTLANNQVWQISDGSTAAYSARQNPKVRVTRGILGSFFLEVEGILQTPRVKRVK